MLDESTGQSDVRKAFRHPKVLEMLKRLAIFVALVAAFTAVTADVTPTHSSASAAANDSVRTLAEEVCGKGWIVFCARSGEGDWDLFLCRPDGSDLGNITHTPAYNEAASQFSRDGRKLLYRRLPRDEIIDGNHYGTQGELVLANNDGTNPQAFGERGEYPWASWSPDGCQLACLSIEGISLVDIATRRVERTLGRKGFFQQMTWSPDGNWLCGVANSFGTGWSVARMEVATGMANAVSRVDCCTPDWFPDSQNLVFSNRPPGQKGNNGQGWTQLWMADAEGKARRLVYGEDGRHVYGGHVSPDGNYVLFTGNMREDGDPGNAGAPMGLMRIADAPIIGGESKELRALHPEAKSGPVLALPVGWEPCWTFAEIPVRSSSDAAKQDDVAELASEVRDKGWIVFSEATDKGDWDLFLMRPDGSNRRQITNTRQYNEAGARFSFDGEKMLYYRMPKTDAIDNNTYGTFELVIGDADGRNAVVCGTDFQWASWGRSSTQIACLDKGGIRVVDLASRKVLRQVPRKGIVEQLVWSPDGEWFAGTANGLGQYWTIGRVSADTGEVNAASETDRYNCTPDWLPDSCRIIYSRGIIPEVGGWAELWVAVADGIEKRLLYAEEGRHIYGGCVSPDGEYVLFTRSEEDLGKVDNSRTTMAIIRWRDTPMVGGNSDSLRKKYPDARRGPVLELSWGWEPHWTYREILPANKTAAGIGKKGDPEAPK
jgi:Tol biopolymer transport system component